MLYSREYSRRNTFITMCGNVCIILRLNIAAIQSSVFFFSVGKRGEFDYALPVGVSKRFREGQGYVRVFCDVHVFVCTKQLRCPEKLAFEANQSAHKPEYHVR